MAINLSIPAALRSFVGGLNQVSLDGQTVGQLLKALATEYPDLSPHLFDETGSLRSYVNVFVDGQNVKNREGLETPVTASQSVTLVPAIAGGRAL
ncbi:MAG: MoaD/ThiS family protein [Deltaproteobacteria bacterium]|jgi:MoaD family protein|nr:MoaD/ThiS family protein [Deltaproteobacteria bacterium]